MLVSKKMLQRYIDIADIDAQELATKVTDAGLEVEGIERLASGTGLIIGEVLTCVDHPDSDHLHVCSVDVKEEVLDIVCGAPNIAAGQKVIVARVGAKLPEIEIKAGSIRGVDSNGMICSLLELGVSEDYLSEESKTGIEVLSVDAPVGETKVLEYLGLDDVVYDIGLTPNRNDCLASWYMALELGAILKKEVSIPFAKDYSKSGNPTNLTISSKSDNCSLFIGKKIGSVSVKPSIPWMSEYLMSAGIKSINNIVDISNIVMLETGQPMHFYDASLLPEEDLHVRDDFEGVFMTLDEREHDIKQGDLMIFSGDTPVGVAGIMGGEDSKTLDTTTSLVLEAAAFNHVSIRNTARRINLNTDASIRFQKGIGLESTKDAMNRAAELLIEYADAKELEETVVYGNPDYTAVTFDVSLQSINQLLGTEFGIGEVMEVLTNLMLSPVSSDDDKISVSIPSYRIDLKEECDIAEEVIRILGYDRLGETLPLMPTTIGEYTAQQKQRITTRDFFCGIGFQEAITYSLISEELKNDAVLGSDDIVELASPMSAEHKYVRASILPSLLEVLAYNEARSAKDVALFEIGNAYTNTGYEERLSAVVNGSVHKNRWLKIDEKADFYTLKGIVDSYLTMLGFSANRVLWKENKKDTDAFHPYRSAEVYIGKDLLGIVGQIHPLLADEYDVNSETIMMELKLDVITNAKVSKIKYVPISKYQSISRDFAFVVSKDIKIGEIEKAISNCGKVDKENVITSIEVFDVYDGQHVDAGYQSIALQVNMESMTHTLSDEDIASVHHKIVDTLAKNFDAKLRG